jgi:hypothetical protein
MSDEFGISIKLVSVETSVKFVFDKQDDIIGNSHHDVRSKELTLNSDIGRTLQALFMLSQKGFQEGPPRLVKSSICGCVPCIRPCEEPTNKRVLR